LESKSDRLLASWINRNQQNVIEYLQEEVKVLKEQLGKKPRFCESTAFNTPLAGPLAPFRRSFPWWQR
jgi:hypothetical protein